MLLADIEAYIRDSVAAHNEDGYFRPPLVAVSAADDPRYGALKDIIGPYHDLPTQQMPGTRAVISFFIPFTAMVVAANRQGPQASEVWARTYVMCNRLINRISQGLVQLLEADGHRAATVAATHTYDPATLKAAWSHKSAACIAGLGQFGRHQLLITEKGCAGRFGTVFTDLSLPPTAGEPSPQRCLFHLDKGCDYCLRACPTDALGADGLDKWACQAQLKTNRACFPHLDTCDSCGKCAMGPCAYYE